MSDLKKLNFVLHVNDITNSSFTLKVSFMQPLYVSSSIYSHDKLVIKFKDASQFVSTKNGMSVDSNFALEVDLPRMSDPNKKEVVSTH